jgi:hypothetical protein
MRHQARQPSGLVPVEVKVAERALLKEPGEIFIVIAVNPNLN